MSQNQKVNPILINFPHEFETERLLILLSKPGDGKAVNEAIKVLINELKTWMPLAQKEPTEEARDLLVRAENKIQGLPYQTLPLTSNRRSSDKRSTLKIDPNFLTKSIETCV